MSAPAAIGPELYRHVFSHLPTGVVVVTAEHAQHGPVGMACNSLTSLSLDPPLLLVCPARSSTTWPAIEQAGRFCVNVMASDQAAATAGFARRGADRFADVAWRPRWGGPALDGALAWIDCRLQALHEAGDHLIAVGEIVALEAHAPAPPLVFFRGRYGTFAEAPAEAAG